METTLNIHLDILRIISRAAKNRGISRSEMMIMLFKRVMEDVAGPARYGSLIIYQERSGKECWHTFHIKLREDDYEYLLDLRKLLKMSVSNILAYAVKKYLKRINTDNNRYKDYVVIKNIRNGLIFWTLIWGYPPDIKKYLPS
jgi:hypothetical protein